MLLKTFSLFNRQYGIKGQSTREVTLYYTGGLTSIIF